MISSTSRARVFITFACLCFTAGQPLFAHREYVHQYLAIEAYKLLVHRYPALAGSEFASHIGTQTGDCSGFPFTDATIAKGAYREDCEDPVYHYGDVVSGLDDAYFSASHFWDADGGDQTTIRICDFTCGDYRNAFQKSLRYVLPGIYGTWTAKLTWPSGYSSFPLQGGGSRIIFHGGLIGFEYDSLAQFYRDGRCRITGYLDYAGRWQTAATLPDRLPVRIIAQKNVRDRIAWEVIGRITHLLGDMGVPAHAHNDIHPPFWWNNEPADVFEEEMSRLYTAWTFEDAADQGHLLETRRSSPGGRPENAMRYLLYTTNQVADRFPSNDVDGDSRYDLSYGGDDYSVLDIIEDISTDPAARNIFHHEAAEYAFVFSMRSIAGLYEWFALEAGMLGRVTVAADFPGAGVLVNSKPRTTPAYFTLPAGTQFTLEAFDQAAVDSASNAFMLRFRDWEVVLPSGERSIATSARLSGTVADRTIYTARFYREVGIALDPPVHLDGGSGGSYTVNGTDVGGAWTGTLNISVTPSIKAGFVPPPGSEFLRWSDEVTGNPRVLRPAGNLRLAALCRLQVVDPSPPGLTGTVVTSGSYTLPRLMWTIPSGVTSSRLYRYACSDSAGCSIAARRASLIYEGSASAFTDHSVAVGPRSALLRAYYYVIGLGQGFTTQPSNTISFPMLADLVYTAPAPGSGLPESNGLGANYPNPFNPSTTVPYRLSYDAFVTITVYNMLGQRVATLYEGPRAAGYYTAEWNASVNPAGVYVVAMEVSDGRSGPGYNERRKLVLLK